MVDTAGTLMELSGKLAGAGARNIYLCASHGLFTNDSMQKIGAPPLPLLPPPLDPTTSPIIYTNAILYKYEEN